ncbi:MAG: hypothetical protein ABIH36_04030, partial [bacterium]
GFNVGHLNHVNFYVATMVLPWLLIAIDAFIKKPTLRRTAIMAAVAAVIPLSGHAQIALYTLLIAALFGIILAMRRMAPHLGGADRTRRHAITRLVAFTILAAVLSLSLASFAILPLFEFLPYSDRGESLSHEELFEFSYPPVHAITLIAPYFFGDHQEYWGAKNFQELAAYVGIIPLLLAGSALIYWRGHRPLRIFSVLLVIIGITFALGKYSPLYRFLVEKSIITYLNIPGRFVFFSDVGLSLLAALGLHNLISTISQPKKPLALLKKILSGLFFAAVLATPFILLTLADPNYIKHFKSLPLSVALIIFGLLVWLFSQFSYRSFIFQQAIPVIIVIISSLSLLFYGWHYNPLTNSSAAQPLPSLHQSLTDYTSPDGTPPRTLSRPALLVDEPNIATNTTIEISDRLTIHQPFHIDQDTLECLLVPMYSRQRPNRFIKVTLRENIHSASLNELIIPSRSIDNNTDQQVCFPELENKAGHDYVLSFSSGQPSGINLYFVYGPVPLPEQAYLVRVANPSAQQLEKSIKDIRIDFSGRYRTTTDPEVALLSRHLQTTAGSSSANWIGAFSVGAYRTFIRDHFANDRDPIDGEGRHFLKSNRQFINMSGITHLLQTIPFNTSDALPQQGYIQLAKHNIGSAEAALYVNPDAYPKAFLVEEEPVQLDLIQKPLPGATASITRYDPAEVTVETNSPQDAYLVLTDTWTPQWHVLLDAKPAPSLVANTVFRSAFIPAGQHTVTFYYHSPAIALAKKLTIMSIAITLIFIIYVRKERK